MITLDAVTKSLEVDLDEAATTELPIVAAWVDITTTVFTPGHSDTNTNDTTAVTAVAAPGASTQRQVKFLSVSNSDNVAHTVTVQYNNNGTLRRIVKVTLAVTDSLVYSSGSGWQVIDSSGGLKTAIGTADVAHGGTGQVTLTDGAFVIGNGTSAVELVGPGSAGQFPISDGTSQVMKTLSGMATLASTGAMTPAVGLITDRTEDTAPVDADYLLTSDTSAAALKKVLRSKLLLEPSVSAYRNADQTSVVTSTHTKVNIDTEVFDTGSYFDSSTNYRFTPLIAGKYLIIGRVNFSSLADGAFGRAQIYKNDAMHKIGTVAVNGGSGDIGSMVMDIIDFNGSSDQVELWCFHNHGADRTLGGGAAFTFFSAVRVSS